MPCLFTIPAIIVILGVIFKLYVKLTTGQCKSQTCLVGKTAIVTGANSGIGFETALDFGKRGARVILACRNRERAEEARNAIVRQTGSENIVVKLLDLASFESVRAFAEDINATESRLDILVNNAGVYDVGKRRTKDGHDLLMQVNYFSSFLLTNLLLESLKKSTPSRIVNVSSMAAIRAKLDLSQIDTGEPQNKIYGISKLCNILFTKELAKKLKGTGVTVYSLHPGVINTDLFRNIEGFKKALIEFLLKVFLKTCEEGAQTTIYCSVAKDIEAYNGEHFSDCKKVQTYKTADFPELATRLWEVTDGIVHSKND